MTDNANANADKPKSDSAESGRAEQIVHLAAQVEALKFVIGLIDSAMRARDVDCAAVMNEAFDQARMVVEARARTPAWRRAGLVLEEMQYYLGATGPVSAATRKR